MSNFYIDSVQQFARVGGALALNHYQRLDELEIACKSRNDLVSNADREVEMLLRASITREFPDDGILGEEYGHEHGASGITWVIDPIDGTANFVRGRPHWCVSIACVAGSEPPFHCGHAVCRGALSSSARAAPGALRPWPYPPHACSLHSAPQLHSAPRYPFTRPPLTIHASPLHRRWARASCAVSSPI